MSHTFAKMAAVACTALALLVSTPATVQAQCPPGDVPVVIDILTDSFPSETTWTLDNLTTASNVGTGGPYGSSSTLFTHSFCVDPDDCYNFTIFDAFGDGICCFWGAGNYSVTFDGVVVASGGVFGGAASHFFGNAPGCGPPPAPANDLLCGAELLTCNTATPGTTTGATDEIWQTDLGPFTFGGGGSPAVWYKVVGNGQCMTVDTCAFAEFNTFTGILAEIPNSFPDNCPAPLVELLHIDFALLNDNSCGTSASVTWGTQVGVNYFIPIGPSGATPSASGDFIVTLTCTPAPINDNVCTSRELLPGVPVLFDNGCATAQAGEVSPGPGTGGDSCNVQNGWCAFETAVTNSLWFNFTAPPSGCVSIGLDADVVGVDLQLAVYQATDCNDFSTFVELAGNDDSGPGFEPFIDQLACLTPGEVYLVQLDGFAGTSGTGFINLTDCGGVPLTADAGDCQSRIINDGEDINDVNYLCITPAGGTAPYSVEWDVQSGDQQSVQYADGLCVAVQPNVTTIYCATITDALGCSITDCVTVEVIDPACGNRGDKVLICHKPDGQAGHEICIDYCGYDAHVGHHDGDHAGPCDNPCLATNPAFPPPPPCEDLTISILADTFGSEISWTLTDLSNGQIVEQVPFGTYPSNTLTEDTFCVDPRHCYQFSVIDAFGDGICCFWGAGNYSVTFQGVTTPSPSGGNYGAGETISVGAACAPPPPVKSMGASVGQELAISAGLGPNGEKGLFLDVVMTPKTSDPRVRAEIVAGDEVLVTLHDGAVEAGTVYHLRGSLEDGLSNALVDSRSMVLRIGSTTGVLEHKTSLGKVFDAHAAGMMQALPAGVQVAPRVGDQPTLRTTAPRSR